MAENEDGQEKTEDPTPKRLQEAREQGNIARSKELNTTAVLLAGAGGLLAFGQSVAEALRDVFTFNFTLPRSAIFDERLMFHYLGHSVYEALSGLVPLFGVLLLAAVLGPIALGGWNFSAKAMAPKFSRLNPLSGLKRMFSKQSLVELVKAVAKVTIVGALSALILYTQRNDLLAIAQEAVVPAMGHALQVLGWSFLGMSATMIVIAVVDIPFQLYQHQQKLKMTLQEVKDEMKNTEGKPEVKGRIRQLQQEMARRRMMADVPQADVVITNPSHYAVALQYDQEAMGAPRLLAKGSDVLAFKIREIALAHEVPVLSAPPLARALYHSTEIGEEIPEGLYIAVAQILAYVYQLKQYQAGKARAPGKVPETPIPDELRRDE